MSMTVGELIAELSKLDPALPVGHDGGGDPYCACTIDTVTVDTVLIWTGLPHRTSVGAGMKRVPGVVLS